MHLNFVVAAANLRAFNYGLKGEIDPAYFKKVLADVIVPEFTPKQGVKIQVNENEAASNQAEADGMSNASDNHVHNPWDRIILT